MELQGYVLVALALILLGYLLPHMVRSRQLLLDSRVEDRFSGDLRIVATAAGVGRQVGGYTGGGGPTLHRSIRRPETSMTSPGADGDRFAVTVGNEARDLAAARAARAAKRARRAAAAQRRLVLTAGLFLAVIATGVAAGVGALAWGVVLVPSALLATVLVLGRRTAIQARANDRRERAVLARMEERLSAASAQHGSRVPAAARRVPRRVRPAAIGDQPAQTPEQSVATTSSPMADGGSEDAEVPQGEQPQTEWRYRLALPAVMGHATASGEEEPEGSVAAEPSAAEPGSWTPVPVPAPAYTLQPRTPRRDVEPFTAETGPSAVVPQRPAAPASSAGSPATDESEQPQAHALDLDAVLARRRAAGA